MGQVTVAEAADLLKVSTQTVKRRLKSGSLRGQQEATPQGYIWLVDMPDDYNGSDTDTTTFPDDISDDMPVGISREIKRMEEMISMLQTELERRDRQVETKDKQIGELHVLLQQVQAALPAPKENHHSWWRFWQK